MKVAITTTPRIQTTITHGRKRVITSMFVMTVDLARQINDAVNEGVKLLGLLTGECRSDTCGDVDIDKRDWRGSTYNGTSERTSTAFDFST
jgi:hypothetical protein